MFKNYFRTALRSFIRNRAFTTINILGLAVGIGSFILLASFLYNEWSYDRFNDKADRICRVKMMYHSGEGSTVDVALTPAVLAPTFKREFPEVAEAVRVYSVSPVQVQYEDKVFNEKKFLYADAGFFNVFSFPLKQGNAATVLKDPNTIVLSEDAAKKYFGNTNPVGKALQLENGRQMLITGVAANVPGNSQIKFDFVGAFSTLKAAKSEVWSNANYITYILLQKKENIVAVQQKADALVKKAFGESLKKGDMLRYELEPLPGIHLHSTASEALEPSGNATTTYILAIVGILLLMVACINYMNLATARSAERAQEIGVRKTLGAVKYQLFWQFIAESALITFVAILLGLLLAAVMLPFFNQLIDRTLQLNIAHSAGYMLLFLLVIFFIITFLAGTYPAIFLSAFQPVKVLKKSSSTKAGGGLLRKGLVVFQFTISAFFIVCTIVVLKQRSFIQHKDLGLDRSFVMAMDVNGKLYDKMEAFKNSLLTSPAVRNVSASYDSPLSVAGGYELVNVQGKPQDFSINVTAVPIEKDFRQTMSIKLVAGSDLTDADIKQIQLSGEDREKRYYHFLLNETAARTLGWKPEEAIGKKVDLNGRAGEIKGIVKDFHFVSLHEPIAPIVLFPEYDYFGKLLVKVNGTDIKAAVSQLQSTWHTFFPVTPFEYHFLDQEFEQLYQAEERMNLILNSFAFITILISCLGLLGLSAFTAEQRTKEIGIRKVLGASVGSIVRLLSTDFLKLVIVAIVIASPIAWWAMSSWLQDFAYRINISWWMFALAGAIAILIALFTISFQAIRAAIANPVNSLKTE